MTNATLQPRKLVLCIFIFAIVILLQIALIHFFESQQTIEQRKLIGDYFDFFDSGLII